MWAEALETRELSVDTCLGIARRASQSCLGTADGRGSTGEGAVKGICWTARGIDRMGQASRTFQLWDNLVDFD